MGLTVAALMKESHTGESAYLTGKGFAGYPASLTGSVQHISGKDFPAGSLLLPLDQHRSRDWCTAYRPDG